MLLGSPASVNDSPLEQAGEALRALKHDGIRGAAVLLVDRGRRDA
jgi:hypothetical protein